MHLYMGKGAIISVENDSSTRMTSTYKFLKPEEYGNIKGSVLARDKKYIIQLLNKQHKIIKEIYTNDQVLFTNIPPGDYRLRIMIDENNNGLWDLGNMAKNKYPEPVYFYQTEEGVQWMTVRANWDITDLLIE